MDKASDKDWESGMVLLFPMVSLAIFHTLGKTRPTKTGRDPGVACLGWVDPDGRDDRGGLCDGGATCDGCFGGGGCCGGADG